jgi:hypothetical protein
VAHGEQLAPEWRALDPAVIRELGLRHEAAHLAVLRESGLEIRNLAQGGDEAYVPDQTRRAMEKGVEVMAQGALSQGLWFGRPDILRKVERQSRLGIGRMCRNGIHARRIERMAKALERPVLSSGGVARY